MSSDGQEQKMKKIIRPIAGLLFNWSSCTVVELASILETLCPEIKIVIAVSGENGISPEEKTALQSTEILFTQPRLIRQNELIHDLPNLKWMHSFAAGVDEIMKYLNKDKPLPNYILTRNAGYFDIQMAEYIIGIIISREYHFEEMKQNQMKRLWVNKVSRRLDELSIGIFGLGNIGKEIARVAKSFGMKVWGVARTPPSHANKVPSLDEYRSLDDMNDVLSACDYIVSVLPSTSNTDGFFDGDTLYPCRFKRPVFMNIGRGNVIEESTVLKALENNWISHAVLDVFSKEPLTVESRLWMHPEVTVTPHMSGICIRLEPFLRTAVENCKRYINGEQLENIVKWERGY